jgi:hypothetical protein
MTLASEWACARLRNAGTMGFVAAQSLGGLSLCNVPKSFCEGRAMNQAHRTDVSQIRGYIRHGTCHAKRFENTIIHRPDISLRDGSNSRCVVCLSTRNHKSPHLSLHRKFFITVGQHGGVRCLPVVRVCSRGDFVRVYFYRRRTERTGSKTAIHPSRQEQTSKKLACLSSCGRYD